MKNLVHENAECPDIRLGAVDVFDQALGRHVDGAADVYVLPLLADLIWPVTWFCGRNRSRRFWRCRF